MSRRNFTVVAKWDEDAKVFYSESDIIGLHIEADTIEGFEAIMYQEAPDLIVANHMSKPELARSNIRDLIPAIFLRTQPSGLAVA
jgi:adenylate kinase